MAKLPYQRIPLTAKVELGVSPVLCLDPTSPLFIGKVEESPSFLLVNLFPPGSEGYPSTPGLPFKRSKTRSLTKMARSQSQTYA